MDREYWQVVAEEEDCKRLEFSTLEGNRWWKLMPIGALDAAPTFLANIMKLQMEWNTLAKECGLINVV